MIIGIHGRAQCGKDTLAAALQASSFKVGIHSAGIEEIHGVGPPCGVRVLHFADTLRDVVEAAFGSRYESAEEKAAVDEWWQERIGDGRGMVFRGAPVTGRAILQRVGTDLFREWVHPNFWLFAMERRITSSKAKHHILADVRFENEARWVKAQKGIVIGLARADHPPLPADAHASELPIAWELLDERHQCDSADAVRTLGAVLARKYLN